MIYRKKLIEVALPLEAINRESAREKSIRHGHPSTLHLWWSRKPLATCRAVLFAQLVDDPSSLPGEFPTEEMQEAERQRLFRIIEDLVRWENTTNETVLHAARVEVARSVARDKGVDLPRSLTPAAVREALEQYAPPVLDPFCGGGSIPLEAQRLGLEAHASDLNPVAVLITKALIEIPPRFAGQPPVNPEARARLLQHEWRGAAGLAEDVRHYGRWMRDEAERRIGHLYPRVRLPKEHGGGEATVIAWLWARTVQCPNPACGAQMPLVNSFWLSTRKGKETWVEPVIEHKAKRVIFHVQSGRGTPPESIKVGRGARFRCVVCSQMTLDSYVKTEGSEGRMGAQLMAIVAEGPAGRLYLPPSRAQTPSTSSHHFQWKPEADLPADRRHFSPPLFGMSTFADLFTPRQLVALTTFSDLVGEARERAWRDGVAAGRRDDGAPLAEGGRGATAYADAVATYLGLGVSRLANRSSAVCFWDAGGEKIQQVFARHAIPMIWDFVEGNPFSDSSGNFCGQLSYLTKVIEACPRDGLHASIQQRDSTRVDDLQRRLMVSTDPPYYDNIGYADLSDFFYVWLRRSLKDLYPDMFSTLLVPKAQELIASPYRFGGDKAKAEAFFERGLGTAFTRLRALADLAYPMTVYYAFKQTETDSADGQTGALPAASTGWETMLEGLLRAGFTITGTWPMRTELVTNLKKNVGALASSIVLACRPRPDDAPLATRREFLSALQRELPEALRDLQRGSIAPVDLAQAAIGPGMAVFSRYARVLESDGSSMRVRTALQLINQALDEVLTEQEGEFDADTRWALAWFEQFALEEGPFGVAETLSKAKNTAVQGLAEAGVLAARAGKVRLLRRDELPAGWDPATDGRLTVWEVTQHLIRALEREGESGAAALLRRVGGLGDVARDLAYRLYRTCEVRGWPNEARAYNGLVIAWPEIARLAGGAVNVEQQGELVM